MPAITSTRTSAAASLADAYPALNLDGLASTNDLIEAFSNIRLNGRGVKKGKTAPQPPQAPQPADGITRPPTINANRIDIERLADGISAMNITKPARRLAQRQAPAVHPYKRPALTKTERILSSHGMAKKGTPVVPDTWTVSPGRLESIASKPCIKMNNATISLLSNAPKSPDTFGSPFNWSTAWLSSASAAPSLFPVIEAQVHVTSTSNNYDGGDLYMADTVVAVATVVENRKSARELGKVTKARAAKNAPYSKEKANRKMKVIKAEPIISKFDAEVASLADMLSLCQLTNGSKGNARLTRSKAQAARRAACHDSGYEGGNED